MRGNREGRLLCRVGIRSGRKAENVEIKIVSRSARGGGREKLCVAENESGLWIGVDQVDVFLSI